MIKDKNIARQIHQTVFESYKQFHRSFEMAKGNCSDADVAEYRRAIAQVMGSIVTEIMTPIEKLHPELKPIREDFKK